MDGPTRLEAGDGRDLTMAKPPDFSGLSLRRRGVVAGSCNNSATNTRIPPDCEVIDGGLGQSNQVR